MSVKSEKAAIKPDLSTLYCDQRPGEFSVELSVSGTVHMTIKAESVEAARRKAETMAETGEIELAFDEVEEVRVRFVSAQRPMYLVKRAGKEMGVSHVQAGDEPTKPSVYMAATYLPPSDKPVSQ